MASNIFELVGSIFIDNDAANKSLQKTDEKAQSVGKSFQDGMKKAGKFAAGVVAGTTAAVGGVIAFANKTSETADNIDKMSQKLGISRESYQELDFILSQSGTSIDSMTAGMKTLLGNMDKVTEGNASAIANFDKLGVSVQNADGSLRTQDEVLYDTITAFQEMEDSAEKTRLAQELLGKSGSELMPLLNGEAGSFENMKNEAHDLGLVLGDDLIDSGVSLKDTMDKIQRTFSSIVTQLGGSVVPIVDKIGGVIIEYMPEIQSMFERLGPVMGTLLDKVMPPLMDLAEEIFPILVDIISEAAPMIAEIVAEILPIFAEILSKILPFLAELVQKILPVVFDIIQAFLPIIEELLPLLEPILDLIMALVTPLLDLVDFILPPILTFIQMIAKALTTVLKPIITWLSDFLGNTLSNTVNDFKDTIRSIPDAFKNAWQDVKDTWSAVTGWFSSLGEGIKTVFTNVGTAIQNAIKKPINFIISGINKFLSGLNKLQIPDWVPAVGGKGFNFKEIPQLAQGGILERGQTGLLEGNGAEAVVPLEQNKKWISRVAEDMDNAMGGSSVVTILGAILDTLTAISKQGIYLDGDKLVGAIAPTINNKLGAIALQKAR